MSQAACSSCGAPDGGEFVLCGYCKSPVSAEAMATAIPCPQCRALCRWGKQQCGGCHAWIVVQCVFCGGLSPCNQSACLACHEAFAGAMERKQMQQQQVAAQQQAMVVNEAAQVAGAVAPILGSILGAIIEAEIERR